MSHAPCQPTSLASRLRLMKLEPRMLFDGAAVAEAVAADTSHDAATAHETEQTAPTPVATAAPATDVTPPGAYGPDVAAELSYFAADGLPPEFQEAAAEASRSILDFARQASDETWYALFNGGGDAADPAWTARLDALRADLLAGNVVLAVQAIDASAMPDAVAAFTASGPDGGMTIFVNTAWTRLLDTPDLARTLVEEFGHAIDYRLNEGRDTPGDEGETFAAEVLGWSEDATRVALENDRRVIEWNGASYVVETATFAFVNAYAVTNLPLSKEQSSVTFDSAAPLGTAVVDDQDFNSKYFSGNDVSAVGLDIGGQLYYGWISRPIKSGGVVRGFYFWTDVNFTDWAKAQADGNQDGDGNPADNQGFVLVVDQAWFDAQGAGSITVGTSSDRVDTAINKEIDKVLENPPPPLVTAGADIADGSNGSVEGVDGDPGVNASGNVLTNDSSLNAGALTVTQISGSGNSASAVSGGTPGSVSGKYGTLTIDANGDYSYVVNNANPTVDALNEGGTLNDVFTYTVTDSKGVAVSATLTVAIQGANDSPNANPDANVAKNHLATNDPGFNATGNVLTNDTDVDSSRADMYVDTDSLLVTGAVDA
ncbi:MAG: VCBS domain-containing protein, partial [Azonexus sp.]|nr:VCBS domain-containing protein [Azonexus sp.]